jgi:amidohydrolase
VKRFQFSVFSSQFVAGVLLAGGMALAADAAKPVDAIYPDLEKLYLDLHQTPELSGHEEKTAAKMAERLRGLGFEVTTGIGGTGVVGVLKNGKGPTVLFRTDTDALPVEERTGLPYASKVTAKDDSGATVHVMHACGHDIHMTAWTGTATLLARSKDRWRGTLVFIAQPDEEKDGGAKRMLDAGLYTKFPRPDFALAIHDSADLPAGTVGVVSGFVMANVDSVDITIYGRGGHGAYPHRTVDPVVIAARTVLALQTIVAREINPLDSAVITVGTIHGGTKRNIIPDEAKLELTVRSYKEDVRRHLLAAIGRVAKAEAASAGAPKEPLVKVEEGYPATYNDPALTARVKPAIERAIGAARVVEPAPSMVAEDFSYYGKAGVPATLFWVGGVPAARMERAKATGAPLPSLHSSEWAPDYETTIKAAVTAEVAALLELLGKP